MSLLFVGISFGFMMMKNLSCAFYLQSLGERGQNLAELYDNL